MRLALVCAVLLCTAASASAALPRHGTLVPGRSLGGVHLGEKAAAVQSVLGRQYGVCRGCRTTTWYFTYRRFTRPGLAVEFTGGGGCAGVTIRGPARGGGPPS